MQRISILLRIAFLVLLTPVSLLFAQSLSITPSNPSVVVGKTVQFSATATGLSSNSVTWSVQGSASGSISSSGLYTAPTTIPGQNPVSVVATSTVNTKISATAYTLLLVPGPTLTSVAPNPLISGTFTVTLTGTGFQQYAQVLDTSNGNPVQLSTTSVTATTIVATGYQPPAPSASFTVTNPSSGVSNAISVPVTGGFTLTVVNGSGSGSYAAGTQVPITANPNSTNKTFTDWTGFAVANATSPSTTLTMPAANATVTANYSGKYVLTVVNGTGSGTYASGTKVPIVANPPPPGQLFKAWTGSTVNGPLSASTTITMPSNDAKDTATYYAPTTIPYPVTTHPRIWITTADLPRLQSWAVSTNPIYAKGIAPLLADAVNIYNTQFFPGGTANPNYPDPGDVQGYTGYLTEQYGAILAFNSLIDPSTTKRIQYATMARNMLMYAMNEAAQGQLANAPFRDPAFAIYNRGNGSGEQWPLIVDWIYNTKDANGNPILTSTDKATIRKVFMIWANSCLNASTTGGDHPEPIGTTNSLSLLPGNLPYRMASNNYYLGHARLLTMMSLSIDPVDDPSINSAQPNAQLGNSLRSYILNANGAWLYQEYAMMGEAQNVATQYGISGTGAGFGLSNGGLPPEGMLYGHSFGYVLGQLLALQTAGFNNPAYSGPQINLIGAPVWDRYIKGYFSSLTPAAKTDPTQTYLGPVYQFASYGDLLRLWVTPDFVQPISLLALLEGENGQTTHQSAAQWFDVNVAEGGANMLYSRITQPYSYSSTDSILYYMLLAPGYTTTDPRPTFATTFVDQPAGRVVSHSDWSSTNTMFDYRASWESINHQQGDAGQFELYRNGEWLTKQMSNYDNNNVGETPQYLNSLSLQNWCASGNPNISWFEDGELALGGQWNLAESAGDPTTLTSTGTGYVFADSNLTNLYNHPDVWSPTNGLTDITRANRSIVWFNNDYVVVYDRATSNHANLFKKFNLSLINNPLIQGQTVTETNPSGQKLFIQSLLPANASISAANDAGNLNPVAQMEPTQYVLSVQDPSMPADTRFLHVLQGANSTVPMVPATHVQSSTGTLFDGAVFGASAVFFINTPTATIATTTFKVPSTVHTMLVTGLTPNGFYAATTSTTGTVTTVTLKKSTTGTTADQAGLLRLTF